MGKSKILIIGATGTLGYRLAETSLRFGHQTFALIRPSPSSDPIRTQKLETLANAGAILLKGSLEDESSLVEALKQVDVVICSIPSKQVLDQKPLIRAIKRAGCIKRFFPSEFGVDPDRVRIHDMDYGFYARKGEIRRLVEAEGIDYTYICCNLFMRILLPGLVQPGMKVPPREKVTVFGSGDVKAVFMDEADVAAFTISAVDDPRTVNKALHLRPPGNVYSMNELVGIWEKKIGKQLERVYVEEEEILKRIKETPYPNNMEMVFIYSVFVKGDQTYFDVESCGGVDGMQLYPDLKYTTIDEYLGTLV